MQPPRIIDLAGPWLVRPVNDAPPSLPVPETGWQPIDLPAAWQLTMGQDFHGPAFLRRSIRLPDDWNAPRTWLRFESVATEARVWIDGREVGGHVGDYVPFQLDITRHVRPGKDIDLLVWVHERPGHITKGFHDVVSLHHGGIWGGVTLRGTGAVAAIPDGVFVHGDARTGELTVTATLEDGEDARRPAMRVRITDPDGREAATFDTTDASRSWTIERPRLWSPDDPALYTAVVELHHDGGVSEIHHRRFGFRSIATDGVRFLLNGSPIHLRGMLHWGHEPRYVAPAPTAEQVRGEFARLKAMGFNAVCLCMVYPPRHFYDIADEVGILIWQEHPVWQSPMDDQHLPEYRRLYRAFMRRDRQHPSVVIVSGACEHPNFHPELAAWWWEVARRELPDRLLQVQTSSFAWSDPAQSDLYDEHTYDNNNRWITYLQDLQDVLAAMPEPKPFVMGETVLFTSWPDLSRMRDACATPDERPWWWPRYYEDARRFEEEARERFGDETVRRWHRQGDRHHYLGRQFQTELFRACPTHAALVTNHLRDVFLCTCGWMDDFDHWRFEPEDCRGWLADAPLLLWTPDHRRSFESGEVVEAHVAVSNFGPVPVDSPAAVACRTPDGAERVQRTSRPITAAPGEVASAPIRLPFPHADRPTPVDVTASLPGLHDNRWRLWIFPRVEPGAGLTGLYRLDGLPFAPEDSQPDEIEKGYSRGFGLPVKRWICRLPDPAELVPHARPWRFDAPLPADAQLILTHKITRPLLDWVDAGGRAILLASKTVGGLGTAYEWLFGQTPLVIEQGPIAPGDSEWIVDLLGMDLTRTYARVVPTDQMSLADRVDPLVRLVYTHDMTKVRPLDVLFSINVGRGWMIVSSLDHRDPAGRWLLHQLIKRAAVGQFGDRRLEAGELDRFTVEAALSSR